MNYAFIGTGNMANAILKGMQVSGKFTFDMIYGFDKNAENLEKAKSFGVIPLSSAEAVTKISDVIILCVKPQNLAELFAEIKEFLKGKTIITIAAGKDIAFYEQNLGAYTALIRVMPNINAKVGSAVSAVCKNAAADNKALDTAKGIMETVGSVLVLSEEFFPLFGAVAGSSVAFVYMYIDALINVMVAKGMDEATARTVAADSVKGSAQLVLGSNEPCLNLTKQVCSPGGTTIEGVNLLNEYGFCDKVGEALEAIMKKDEILRTAKA